MQYNFVFVSRETLTVPSERQVETFTFKTYAPTAFKYFRDLFGIPPDSFMVMCFFWNDIFKKTFHFN